ncbi:hypothetical protein HF086_012553 [Spodoptera exigua]|uniref:Protein lingerer n=1 Tax=Spodoptera exigua TaxID=7107 RepID=A0A922M6G2_SPOEX|nr:hypothetical protein HF086_012553 [Spodoptera exigua]
MSLGARATKGGAKRGAKDGKHAQDTRKSTEKTQSKEKVKPQATTEQIRMAHMIDRKSDDASDVRKMVLELMEMTCRTEEEVCSALHDSDNDMVVACNLLLEESQRIQGEWQTSEKKKKKPPAPAGNGELDPPRDPRSRSGPRPRRGSGERGDRGERGAAGERGPGGERARGEGSWRGGRGAPRGRGGARSRAGAPPRRLRPDRDPNCWNDPQPASVYTSNYGVYGSTDITSQRKPQRARVPPPSKIPSSAVEMPGGADGAMFLDVQFGALEPEALRDNTTPKPQFNQGVDRHTRFDCIITTGQPSNPD